MTIFCQLDDIRISGTGVAFLEVERVAGARRTSIMPRVGPAVGRCAWRVCAVCVSIAMFASVVWDRMSAATIPRDIRRCRVILIARRDVGVRLWAGVSLAVR